MPCSLEAVCHWSFGSEVMLITVSLSRYDSDAAFNSGSDKRQGPHPKDQRSSRTYLPEYSDSRCVSPSESTDSASAIRSFVRTFAGGWRATYISLPAWDRLISSGSRSY